MTERYIKEVHLSTKVSSSSVLECCRGMIGLKEMHLHCSLILLGYAIHPAWQIRSLHIGKHVDKSSLLQNSKGFTKIVEDVPLLFERCKQVGGSLHIDRDTCWIVDGVHRIAERLWQFSQQMIANWDSSWRTSDDFWLIHVSWLLVTEWMFNDSWWFPMTPSLLMTSILLGLP